MLLEGVLALCLDQEDLQDIDLEQIADEKAGACVDKVIDNVCKHMRAVRAEWGQGQDVSAKSLVDKCMALAQHIGVCVVCDQVLESCIDVLAPLVDAGLGRVGDFDVLKPNSSQTLIGT